MATYLQLSPLGPAPLPTFEPDFSFLQRAAQVRSSLYDQGYSKVKSLHNSMLATKATNQGLQEKQQQYLNDVENKLKNLPNVDLSLESNVTAAKGVFNDFLNDGELLHDLNITKTAKERYQIGQSFLMSDDPKKRAMHSSISDAYTQIPLDELRRAKIGDGSIYKVKPRDYVPAVDLSEKFKDFLNVNNYKLSSETPNGRGYMVKTSGGKLLELPLYGLMNSLLTGDERRYFDAWGEVSFNNSLNSYMRDGKMSEDDARNEIAKGIFQENYKYYSNSIGKLDEGIKVKDDQIEAYIKKYFPDGKILIDGSEVSQGYQQLVSNKAQYEKERKEYQDEKGKLDDPNTANTQIDLYKKMGHAYFGKTYLENTLKGIARNMAAITASTETKTDEPYWNLVAHNDKQQQMQTSIAVANINKFGSADGTVGSSGVTFGVNPVTGDIEMVGDVVPHPSQKAAKETEAEKAIREANTPDYVGIQYRPKKVSPVDQLYNSRKQANNQSIGMGLKFIESTLREELGGFAPNLLKRISEQHLSGLNNSGKQIMTPGLSGKVALEYTEGKSPLGGGAGSEQVASFQKFKEKYGKEFDEWLTKKTNGTATYMNIFAFLLDRANDKFDRGLVDDSKKQEIYQYKNLMNKNVEIINQIDDQAKQLGSYVIPKVLSPNDVNLLTKLDENGGFRRMKTLDEIKEEYADAGSVVGRTTVAGAVGGMAGAGAIPQTITTYKNPQLKKALEPYITEIGYQTKLGSVNDQIIRQMPSLFTTAADNPLIQYGVFNLKDLAAQQGEVAEKGINMLFSPKILSDLTADIDTAPEKAAIDYTQYSSNKEAVNTVVNQLKNYFYSADKGNTTIRFGQFDPTYRGDDKETAKAYTLYFDASVLSKLKSEYSAKNAPSYATEALAAIKNIEQNGLTVRTSLELPGVMAEYDVFERTLQDKGFYESPAWMNKDFNYTISKNHDDSGYIATGKYHYLDEEGKVREMPLGDMSFQGRASFKSITETIDKYIFSQIALAKSKYEQAQEKKKQSGAQYMTRAEADAFITSQIKY
jgi:hypothetical protein